MIVVWVISRFRLKAPPGISSSCISPLTSSGQRSRASWASQPQKSAALSPQPARKPRKFITTCGGIGGGELSPSSCPAICCVLLIATYTLSRHPLHGCVRVRRGSITPLIPNLWIRWSEWPALSPVDLHPGESPPSDHGIWCSVDTRAGPDALKERGISCLGWKSKYIYSTVQSMPLFGGSPLHKYFWTFSPVIPFIHCFTVRLLTYILNMVKPRKTGRTCVSQAWGGGQTVHSKA